MSPAVFAHGHLRLFLLHLLEAGPKHGYELMRDLSDRFGGAYTPSAGTIYPRLGKLQEEGRIERTEDGRKSVYAITDAGRAELAERAEELAGIELEVGGSVRSLAREVRSSVDEAMRSLRAELAAARTEPQQPAPASAERSAPADERMRSRLALRDAEQAITDFRTELRTVLREAAGSGQLDETTPALLERRLAELREEIVTSLRI